MRKYIAYVIAIGLLIVADYSHYHRDYQLICENGNYYVVIDSEETASDTDNLYGLQYIHFSSHAEMIEDIRTGDFSEDEWYVLEQWARSNDGKASVANIDSLLEPQFPQSAGAYKISMCKADYSFSFYDSAYAQTLDFSFTSKSHFDEQLEKYQNFVPANGSVNEIQHESDRNATVFYYSGHSAERKLLVYTLHNEGATYFVIENYNLETSDMVPEHIRIYAEKNGCYFYVWALELTERPSVEWITAFSIQEYIAD